MIISEVSIILPTSRSLLMTLTELVYYKLINSVIQHSYFHLPSSDWLKDTVNVGGLSQ